MRHAAKYTLNEDSLEISAANLQMLVRKAGTIAHPNKQKNRKTSLKPEM